MTKHMWHKEIKAWADGNDIEYFSPSSNIWNSATTPIWSSSTQYRVKPKEPIWEYQILLQDKSDLVYELTKGFYTSGSECKQFSNYCFVLEHSAKIFLPSKRERKQND